MRALQKVSSDALLDELRERLKSVETTGDWVDDFAAGEVLRTDEAAFIAGSSSETIRRRCIEAADAGHPIGVLIAKSVWLLSKRRLLDDIERREGKAESCAALRLDDKSRTSGDAHVRWRACG
jgi:hypothetical protein